MARKGCVQRFIAKFAPSEKSEYALGGFIAPSGNLIPAYGNHEAMAQVVRTSVKGLVQAGMVRYHVSEKNRFGASIGVDAPSRDKLTIAQSTKLYSVLRRYAPVIVTITQVGHRVRQFGDAYTSSRCATPGFVIHALTGDDNEKVD